MVAINARELRRMYDLEGPARTVSRLGNLFRERKLNPQDQSIRDCFVGLVEDGQARLDAMSFKKSGGLRLLEAASAVDTSAFSNITGQIIYSRVMQEFENPALIWRDLFDQQQTSFLDGEKIPGIGGLGDAAELVAEADEYPTIGLNEQWLQTGRLAKRGFIVPVTREIIVADRTSLVLKMAGDGAKYMAMNCEKRALDVAFGVTNNYNRNGTSLNTFLTSGAYINDKASNALYDWKSVESLDLLFDAMTDPNTGEPILCAPDTLVVPTALVQTANRFLNATEVRHVDNTVNATSIQTIGSNPMAGRGIKVVSNAYVKLRSGSATKWYYGKPKEAMCRFYAWDVETDQQTSNSEVAFTRDINMRFKVSLMDFFQMMEPRKWCRSDA